MDFEAARAGLVEHLRTEIKDERVLAAMAHIPRERLVPPQSQKFAYDDRPLPIGFDQTISQPLIIAIMTEALELTGNEKVLEVGTGSGKWGTGGIVCHLSSGFLSDYDLFAEDNLIVRQVCSCAIHCFQPFQRFQIVHPYCQSIVAGGHR